MAKVGGRGVARELERRLGIEVGRSVARVVTTECGKSRGKRCGKGNRKRCISRKLLSIERGEAREIEGRVGIEVERSVACVV